MKISSLKNENQRLKDENKYLKNEINNKNENLNKCNLKIKELNTALSNKIYEINNLNDKMINLKLNDNKKEYIEINELLIIQFKSIEQNVDISYPCKKTDIFVRILYNDYPEFKDLNTYFTVNGHIVKRFRSMQENSIRNNDKILLNIYE